MRDPMVTIALAGTARQERVSLTTGTPVDAVLAELPEGEVERTFLLSAGAWAVYRQAGTQTQQLAETHPLASEESVRECSPGAALLISRLLSGEQVVLLPEALKRLHQQGLRLPFRLLPLALNTNGKEMRATIFPLLGERGRWLSQFNESWKWVGNYLAVDDNGWPADAETIWQEGTPGQRTEILRLLRNVDPGKAREWLQAVWKQEKAETRSDFVDTLLSGLSADDEPFLENALDDRVGGVRATAASLLFRLPNSAFCERMRRRAQDMLFISDGSIQIKLPSRFNHEWSRDGIVEASPQNISKRAWWMVQIIASSEPTFWETHLDASPAELLNRLPADDDWKIQVIEGWSRAAIKFRSQDWLKALWSWWYEHYQEIQEKQTLIEHAYREQLFKFLPSTMAEGVILDLLEKSNDDKSSYWSELLSEFSGPWSAEFARTYLRLFRERFTSEIMLADAFNPYTNPWLQNLSSTALALPIVCFAEALQSWDFPEENRWNITQTRQQMQNFAETIQMRQKIYEEIV